MVLTAFLVTSPSPSSSRSYSSHPACSSCTRRSADFSHSLQFLHITIGYIRGTIFDFGIFGFLYDDTNWLNLVILGLVNSVVFYFVFRSASPNGNWMTLGREKAMADRTCCSRNATTTLPNS